MGIRITCKCGKQYHLADEWAGKDALCQICKVAFVVPAPAAPSNTRAAQGSSPVPKQSGGGGTQSLTPDGADVRIPSSPPPRDIASHARRTGRLIIGLALSALTFALVCLFVWVRFFSRPQNASLATDMIIVFVAGFIGDAARRTLRRGRQVAQPTLEEASLNDQRPPILFLRPFRFDAFSEAGYEERLVECLRAIGPVVAIGRPGELFRPLGALRTYASNEEWQGKVRQMAAKSALIVLVMDNSPGTVWELREMYLQGLQRRLVILFPPAEYRSAKWAADWENFFTDVVGHPNVDPAAFAIVFDEESRGRILRAGGTAAASLDSQLNALRKWAQSKGLIEMRAPEPKYVSAWQRRATHSFGGGIIFALFAVFYGQANPRVAESFDLTLIYLVGGFSIGAVVGLAFGWRGVGAAVPGGGDAAVG